MGMRFPAWVRGWERESCGLSTAAGSHEGKDQWIAKQEADGGIYAGKHLKPKGKAKGAGGAGRRRQKRPVAAGPKNQTVLIHARKSFPIALSAAARWLTRFFSRSVSSAIVFFAYGR